MPKRSLKGIDCNRNRCTRYAYSLVDHKNLGTLDLVVAGSSPIIMVNYGVLKTDIIIDGNHRVARQYKSDPNGQISGFALNPHQQYEAMAGEIFRVLYKIHHNINLMGAYIYGLNDKVKLVNV